MKPTFTLNEIKSFYCIELLYRRLKGLPEETGVRKGDFLVARSSLDNDPLFRDSEVFVIGMGPENIILGTSFRKEDPCYLHHVSWGLDQLNRELKENYWSVRSPKMRPNILNYVKSTNGGENREDININ